MAVASLFEDLLDQYKIEQHIAQKPYTDLYQAYDVDDDRVVRLDILRAEATEDAAFAGRFVSRARALAQVRHPNIAQVLHVGKATGGAPYVAQAAVEGYSLSHRLEQLAQRQTPANAIYALKLIRQLADALLLAERLEIFHYDLQPDNVLLKNVTLPTDDNVVLIDLFIPARRRPAKDPAETLAFLSPEQRAGRDVTAAGHVYSLGAMLFRLLAGQLPNRPVTMKDTILDRILGRATALERTRGDLSTATYQLVDRSLRRDPRGRDPDIGTFIAALDGALVAEENRLGAVAPPPTPARRSLAWLLPLLILALFLAVGALAGRGLLARAGEDGATATSVVGLAAGATETEAPASPTIALTAPAAATVADTVAPQATEAALAYPAYPAPESPTPAPTTAATTTTAPTATSTLSPTPAPLVRVMLNLVNLRRGPGIVYPLSGSVAGGETLEVLAWNNDAENPWYLIVTDDQRIGWIAATVVQAEDAAALAAVPPAATLPPTPLPTPTTTPTPTVALAATSAATLDPGDLGGVATEPPDQPTDEATEPPAEPTATPPPLTTEEP